MASSNAAATEIHRLHHDAELCTLPATPPSTPSGQSVALSTTDDTLSPLLHRLLITPNLSAPLSRRLLNRSTTPSISLIHYQQDLLLSSAANHGFFHLTDHGIPSHLLAAALTEAQSLLSTTPPNSSRKHSDEPEETEDTNQVFDVGTAVFDGIPALEDYARCLEKVGLEVVEMLVGSGGLTENPFREGMLRPRCSLWVSSSPSAPATDEVKSYPYVVCLQYQKEWKNPCQVLDDDLGEWIPVKPTADSILVTLGDVAQVWSNGRFKKVKGMPQHPSHTNFGNDNHIVLSLLVTLQKDTIISPLSVPFSQNHNESSGKEIEDNEKRFHTFLLN